MQKRQRRTISCFRRLSTGFTPWLNRKMHRFWSPFSMKICSFRLRDKSRSLTTVRSMTKASRPSAPARITALCYLARP